MTEDNREVGSSDGGDFSVFRAIGKSHENAFANQVVEEFEALR